jgi:uncharacterized sporulation protein YeaH/YhbH (DUF444 family)
MHIVDRRLNPSSKSLENRQRFLRRAKALVQGAVKKASQDRDIKDVLEGGEVSIPLDGMNEPRFYREGGIRDRVLPGNVKFVEGDYLQRPQSKSGRSNDAGEGDGEDAFRFVLSREEFVDIFLDDLELPDLSKRKLAEVENEGLRRAGYTTSGSPANISVSRTVRLAMARRVALQRPRPEAIAQLEAELEHCSDERRPELLAEITRLKSKMRRIPFIDPIDIRYRRFENVPKPVAQAVMFCLMDVSGSMDEQRKDLSKRFFILLYLFLNRNYEKIEVVFIRHHTRAEEVDEDTFFHSTESGGTVVSSALELMKKIMDERYSPTEWNIYGAQASDGDNWTDDSPKCRKLLSEDILPKVRYFAYIQVAPEEQNLWLEYAQLALSAPELAMKKVESAADIYPVFRELFEKQQAAA